MAEDTVKIKEEPLDIIYAAEIADIRDVSAGVSTISSAIGGSFVNKSSANRVSRGAYIKLNENLVAATTMDVGFSNNVEIKIEPADNDDATEMCGGGEYVSGCGGTITAQELLAEHRNAMMMNNVQVKDEPIDNIDNHASNGLVLLPTILQNSSNANITTKAPTPRHDFNVVDEHENIITINAAELSKGYSVRELKKKLQIIKDLESRLPFNIPQRIITKKVNNCKLCAKRCYQDSQFNHHMEQHRRNRIFCVRKTCDSWFSSLEDCEKHEFEAHDIIQLKCNVCNHKFRDFEQLTEHKIKMHGKLQRFVCSLCRDWYISAEEMKQHWSLLPDFCGRLANLEAITKTYKLKSAPTNDAAGLKLRLQPTSTPHNPQLPTNNIQIKEEPIDPEEKLNEHVIQKTAKANPTNHDQVGVATNKTNLIAAPQFKLRLRKRPLSPTDDRSASPPVIQNNSNPLGLLLARRITSRFSLKTVPKMFHLTNKMNENKEQQQNGIPQQQLEQQQNGIPQQQQLEQQQNGIPQQQQLEQQQKVHVQTQQQPQDQQKEPLQPQQQQQPDKGQLQQVPLQQQQQPLQPQKQQQPLTEQQLAPTIVAQQSTPFRQWQSSVSFKNIAITEQQPKILKLPPNLKIVAHPLPIQPQQQLQQQQQQVKPTATKILPNQILPQEVAGVKLPASSKTEQQQQQVQSTTTTFHTLTKISPNQIQPQEAIGVKLPDAEKSNAAGESVTMYLPNYRQFKLQHIKIPSLNTQVAVAKLEAVAKANKEITLTELLNEVIVREKKSDADAATNENVNNNNNNTSTSNTLSVENMLLEQQQSGNLKRAEEIKTEFIENMMSAIQNDDSSLSGTNFSDTSLGSNSITLMNKPYENDSSGGGDPTHQRSRSLPAKVKAKAKEKNVPNIPQSESGDYICPRCGRRYALAVTVQEHLTSNCGRNLRHQCEVCHKCFFSTSTLNCHRTVHTGVLPHKCNYCDKRFRTRGQVTVHHRTHTGERPFVCEICSQSFTHRETLISHLSRHIGMKRYKCYGCNKHFSCISGLSMHRASRSETCGKFELNTRAIGPRVRVIRGRVVFEPSELPDIIMDEGSSDMNGVNGMSSLNKESHHQTEVLAEIQNK